MSVVITTYTLASGPDAAGHDLVAGDADDPARQRDRARADDPQRARRHEVRRVVPGAVPRRFGVRGANVPAMLRALVACGWFGIQTWIGALALNTLLTALLPAWAELAAGVWISFAVFWVVQVWLILRGMEGIRHLESWAAPLLLGGGLLLLGVGDRPRRRAGAHPQRVGPAAAGRRRRSGSCSRRR